MKMTYEELIEKYPNVKDRVSEQEWKEIFGETVDTIFEMFYLEK